MSSSQSRRRQNVLENPTKTVLVCVCWCVLVCVGVGTIILLPDHVTRWGASLSGTALVKIAFNPLLNLTSWRESDMLKVV